MAQKYRAVLPKILAGETVGAADADTDGMVYMQQQFLEQKQQLEQSRQQPEQAADASPPPPAVPKLLSSLAPSSAPAPAPPELTFEWASMEGLTVVGRAFDDTPYPFSRLPRSV
jgi:hypothetical protein